ncbi:MAG: cation transporter [Candidatus Margulisbacteria bacterium]|jgi:copper chaperone|nr:cation transporter [Candidatus Margulisiibacteriota bacterium]
MQKIILHVEGMSCTHCVRAVTAALNSLPGTANVLVSLTDKTAVLDYAPAQVSPDLLKAAVEEQGYTVS